jgi:hypothetical protein
LLVGLLISLLVDSRICVHPSIARGRGPVSGSISGGFVARGTAAAHAVPPRLRARGCAAS